MGKRSVASATVSFGLVSIPVKFYKSASADNVSFNLFTPDGNGVSMQFVDKVTRKEVTKAECKKGYEYIKGKHVLFTDEELKALGEADNGSMEIVEFVPASHLDEIRVEEIYWLDTGKGGDKAYRLLVEALKIRKVVAIAQWIRAGREHLMAVGVRGEALIAYQLFYDAEVRSFDLDCAKYTPREAEVNMACQLVDALTHDSFDGAKYVNRYSQRVEAAVQKKLGGGTYEATSEPATKPANDLMAALEASLKKNKVA